MLYRKYIWVLVGLLGASQLFTGCYNMMDDRIKITDLKVDGVFPIESPYPVEPSGLCIRDGVLYSVSDDTPDWIFKIEVGRETAEFVPYLEFKRPDETVMDLEGIEVGPDGSFYILNEESSQVLQVMPDGSSRWVTPNAVNGGKKLGLFGVKGGRAEGMTQLGDGSFLLLAERQPRGWLTVGATGVTGGAKMKKTRFTTHKSIFRIPDFTGAAMDEGKIWVLHRNLELIGTLELDGSTYAEGEEAWSFRHIVTLTDWAYVMDRFGTAEGLAVDENYFYVVLDNNGSSRKLKEEDTRPLLMILKKPYFAPAEGTQRNPPVIQPVGS